MRRRHIALKIAPTQWGFAVASGDQTEATLLNSGFFARDPQRPLADQLAEILGPLQLTDRLACALPAQSALLRWLEFPFHDPRKIAAAAVPEMACQLPVPLDKRVVFHQTLSPGRALAAAVEPEQVAEVIAQFDDNREPLGYLGLSPFCYIAGLDWPDASLLLCVEENGISLSRIEDAAVVDLRILPRTTAVDEQMILQQAQLLAHCGKSSLSRLRLVGIAADSRLAQSLEQAGFVLEALGLDTPNGRVADDLAAVACLALAATKARPGGLNLRSGPYQLKNDWQALKRRTWVAAALLLATLLIFSGSGYLQYSQRSAELAALQQQMQTLYQQQFPGTKLLVPAPLQLQSKLQELRKKARQLGTDSAGALQILLAVSKNIDAGLPVDVREYLHSDEGVRLSGSTESFDAVSRLLGNLQQEPLFKQVRILDSKQAIDGSRVDFQLQVQLNSGKGE